MADDFRKFASRMKKLGKRVERNGTVLQRKCALAVDATVVLATPVDTGRARSNWQTGIGAPVEGVREAFTPGANGSTSGANTNAALQESQRVIATHQKGQDIHITNNLPYIGRLNEGSSAQAPAGFVQTAVLEGLTAVRAAPGIVSTDIPEV